MSLVNLAHVCSHLQNASLARLGLTSVPYTKLHLQIALLLQKQGFFSTVDVAGPTPPLSRFAPGTQDVQQRLPSPGFGVRREALLTRLVKHREQLEANALRPFQEKSPEDIRRAMKQYAEDLCKARPFMAQDVMWALSHSHRTEHDILTNGVDVEAMGLTIHNQPLDHPSRTIDTTSEGIITQQNRASRRLWLGLKYWNGEPVLRKARMISKPSKRVWMNTSQFARVIRGAEAGEVKGMTKIGEVMVVSTDKGILDARECVERKIGGQPLARFY